MNLLMKTRMLASKDKGIYPTSIYVLVSLIMLFCINLFAMIL